MGESDEPISANTESLVCIVCCPCESGSTINQVSPPHPTWTNTEGKSVILLNAIELGGMNGLNS